MVEVGVTWMADFMIFYRAALALRLGESPYSIPGFYNPIWALLPFLPLSFLPVAIATGIYASLTFVVIITALYLLHVRRWRLIAVVLLSPLVWLNLKFANIDSLILLGAALPPLTGIWLVALKPQTGIVLIAWWALRSYRAQGWRGVGRLLAPVVLALAASAILFGWPRPDLAGLSSWSADLFPYGLPLAGWLIVQAWRREDRDAALAAGLFLAPYVGITSWLILAPFGAKRSGLLAALMGLGWWGLALWKMKING